VAVGNEERPVVFTFEQHLFILVLSGALKTTLFATHCHAHIFGVQDFARELITRHVGFLILFPMEKLVQNNHEL